MPHGSSPSILLEHVNSNMSCLVHELQPEPAFNQVDDFGQRCLGFKGWQGSCEAFGQYEWWELRQAAAEKIKEVISAADLEGGLPDLGAIVEEVVSCHRCTTRLVQVFAPTVRILWSSATRW